MADDLCVLGDNYLAAICFEIHGYLGYHFITGFDLLDIDALSQFDWNHAAGCDPGGGSGLW